LFLFYLFFFLGKNFKQ